MVWAKYPLKHFINGICTEEIALKCCSIKIWAKAKEEECCWCSPGRRGRIPTSSLPVSPGWGCRWRGGEGTKQREGTAHSGTGGPSSPMRPTAKVLTTAGSLRGSWGVCCRPRDQCGWTSPVGAIKRKAQLGPVKLYHENHDCRAFSFVCLEGISSSATSLVSTRPTSDVCLQNNERDWPKVPLCLLKIAHRCWRVQKNDSFERLVW